eukprot:1190467-Prorocentrum_minimum.AAC.3
MSNPLLSPPPLSATQATASQFLTFLLIREGFSITSTSSGSQSCTCSAASSNCPSSSNYASCGGSGLTCGARVTGHLGMLGYVVKNGEGPSASVLICYDNWSAGHFGNSYGCDDDDGSCTAFRGLRCTGSNAWWTSCTEVTFVSAAAPTVATPTSNSGFTVMAGPCQLNDAGRCFQSPNYPSNYGNSESCVIRVNAASVLEVLAFTTESCCDSLQVNGVWYAGTDGPAVVR